MKSLKAFVAALLLLLTVPAGAQQVTLKMNKVPLITVLDEISAQTGYVFYHSRPDVDPQRVVSVSLKKAPLETALREVFKGTNISWTINGTKIYLTGGARQSASQKSSAVPVRGRITDADGVPVIGAGVLVKGAPGRGTATDLDGNFTLTASPGEILSISSVGYEPVEVKITGGAPLQIVLEESAIALDDVVVVGYGTQRRESVVGAIAQVSTDAIVNSGTTNISQSIAGKLSGVQTYQSSGQPGNNDATILIRGLSSWNGNSPLVMVDGIERSFSDLDPNEVKSISVLKDASATAVFGAKGANGVILVTTRTGLEGRPKMRLTVDYGLDTPVNLPQFVPSATIIEMANVAYKNQLSFGSIFSDQVIAAYRGETDDPIDRIRYPNNDWFGMLLNKFAQNFNANYNISGGTSRMKYFVSAGYTHEGSIVKRLNEWDGTTFSHNKINLRSNLDFNLTRSTLLSVKVAGSSSIVQRPSAVTVANLFNSMYQSSPAQYPAYFPEWVLEEIPDPDYPDATGRRLSDSGGAYRQNPYYLLSCGDFEQTTTNRLATDLILNQKLDFITKGLSASAKVALTTQYARISESGDHSFTTYHMDWARYDAGDTPWISSKSGNGVEVDTPYKISHNNAVQSSSVTFYWEAALNYKRKFAGRHNVSALALINQRESISNASFPRRSMAYVGRLTYDYRGTYLLEGNVGYTGSEQFAPKNRFGLFPAVAVGYVISNEPFWKQAMPWWSKMKLRYSDGLVGSDTADARWLYYSSFSKSGDFYYEDASANDTARWETAHKRDLGIEMGWMKDILTLEIDLFDEHRRDMLIPPVVTPLVGVGFKDVNRGEMKKHGFETEIKYRQSLASGYSWEAGAMVGFNENRILNYEDFPYAPEYQKYVNKPYGAMREGIELVDDGYFNSIDELHGYPSSQGDWNYLMPGSYKHLDYKADAQITTDDKHVVFGSKYPMFVYSFSLGFGYKGFSASCLFYGNAVKFTEFTGVFEDEFSKGDLVAHTAQLDYWTPTNQNAGHRNLTFYDTLGSARIPGHSWRRSDYLNIKEVYLAYKFNSNWLQKHLGVSALRVTATGNNLFTWTGLIEGDPQRTTLENSYYPMMRVIKLGVKLDF